MIDYAKDSTVGQIVDSVADSKLTLREALDLIELRIIRRAVSDCGGNQVKASVILGIHRNTIRRKLGAV